MYVLHQNTQIISSCQPSKLQRCTSELRLMVIRAWPNLPHPFARRANLCSLSRIQSLYCKQPGSQSTLQRVAPDPVPCAPACSLARPPQAMASQTSDTCSQEMSGLLPETLVIEPPSPPDSEALTDLGEPSAVATTGASAVATTGATIVGVGHEEVARTRRQHVKQSLRCLMCSKVYPEDIVVKHRQRCVVQLSATVNDTRLSGLHVLKSHNIDDDHQEDKHVVVFGEHIPADQVHQVDE